MPLPKRAYEYLSYALMTLKPTGRRTHYYDFAHAKKPEESHRKGQNQSLEKPEKDRL